MKPLITFRLTALFVLSAALISVGPSLVSAQDANIAGLWSLYAEGTSTGCTEHTPGGIGICGSFVMGDPDITVSQVGTAISASQVDPANNPFALGGTIDDSSVSFTIVGLGITPGIGPATTTYTGIVTGRTIEGDFSGSASWSYLDGDGDLVTETATWTGTFEVLVAHNLLVNPDLNANLDGWDLNPNTAFDATRGSPSPGSARWAATVSAPFDIDAVVMLHQCVNGVIAGATYSFGGRLFLTTVPGGAVAGIGVVWSSDPACAGADDIGLDVAPAVSTIGTVQSTGWSAVAPAGAVAAEVTVLSGIEAIGPGSVSDPDSVVFVPGSYDVSADTLFFQRATSSDFNGDGASDIVWRNYATGQNYVWYMNGATQIGGVFLPSLTDMNWQIVGVGDFNADGSPDIVWRSTAGTNYVWYMNGAVQIGGAWLPTLADTTWQIVGVGDFNADGSPDILWRNAVAGSDYVWYMNGAVQIGGAWLPTLSDTTWQIVGVGDFNADGSPDILWRNAIAGSDYVWYMSGAVQTGGAWLPSVADTTWQIVGVGDFNWDGSPDIVWRNAAAGSDYVWYMSGAVQTGGAWLPSVPDTNWAMLHP
jgi:hypothetical protein